MDKYCHCQGDQILNCDTTENVSKWTVSLTEALHHQLRPPGMLPHVKVSESEGVDAVRILPQLRNTNSRMSENRESKNVRREDTRQKCGFKSMTCQNRWSQQICGLRTWQPSHLWKLRSSRGELLFRSTFFKNGKGSTCCLSLCMTPTWFFTESGLQEWR